MGEGGGRGSSRRGIRGAMEGEGKEGEIGRCSSAGSAADCYAEEEEGEGWHAQ